MARKKICSLAIGIACSFLFLCSSTTTAEQVVVTNKKDACKFSWPLYFAYEKFEAAWEGPCVGGFAEGEGTIKFTVVYSDKTKFEASGIIAMKHGLAHGKASLRWSDGASFAGEYADGERKSGTMRYSDGAVYEGDFKNGDFEGKGIYRYPDGSSYEGDFLNNKRHGYGTLKDKTGKVGYQGEWVNDLRADDPGSNRSLTGFLEMPWGTSRAKVEETLNNRQGTNCSTVLFSKVCGTGANFPAPMNGRYYWVAGKVNNEPAQIIVWFYEDKLVLGRLIFNCSEQEILSKFDTIKNQLTERYGKPNREDGKYLDVHVSWIFNDGNDIQMVINKSKFNFPGKPFDLRVDYAQRKMVDKVQANSTSTKNDL